MVELSIRCKESLKLPLLDSFEFGKTAGQFGALCFSGTVWRREDLCLCCLLSASSNKYYRCSIPTPSVILPFHTLAFVIFEDFQRVPFLLKSM